MDPIDPNKPIQTIAQPKKGNGRSTPGKTSFDAVFKQQLDADNAQPTATNSIQLTSGIHPAQFPRELHSSGKTIADQIDQLLDTMAAYSDKLAERGTPLKEIAPLVQQMESQSRSLSAISAASDEQDAALQKMIDQSLMLSTLEISKYRSGTYNDG